MSESDNDNPIHVAEEVPKTKFKRESLFLGVEDAFTFDFGLSADAPTQQLGSGIGFGDDENDTAAADTPALTGSASTARPPLSLEEVEALVAESEKLSHLFVVRPFSNLNGSHYIREAVENHFIDLVETLKRTHERKVASAAGPSASSSTKHHAGKTGRHRPNKADANDDSDGDSNDERRPRTRGGRAEGGRGGRGGRGGSRGGRGGSRGGGESRGRGGGSRGRGGEGRGRGGDTRGRGGDSRPHRGGSSRGRGGAPRGRGAGAPSQPPKTSD